MPDLDCDVLMVPADGKSVRTVFVRAHDKDDQIQKFKIVVGPIPPELIGYEFNMTIENNCDVAYDTVKVSAII